MSSSASFTCRCAGQQLLLLPALSFLSMLSSNGCTYARPAGYLLLMYGSIFFCKQGATAAARSLTPRDSCCAQDAAVIVASSRGHLIPCSQKLFQYLFG
jgi:hypothetical protein